MIYANVSLYGIKPKQTLMLKKISGSQQAAREPSAYLCLSAAIYFKADTYSNKLNLKIRQTGLPFS